MVEDERAKAIIYTPSENLFSASRQIYEQSRGEEDKQQLQTRSR